MTEYQIYQNAAIVLCILIAAILLYDAKSSTGYNFNFVYHIIRLTVVILLGITLAYNLIRLDEIEEKQNAKKFEQHFKIEEQDEKYITKFQQEFLQNMIDIATKYTDSNEILLIPVNDKGYVTLDIQTEQLKELEKDNYYKKNKERFEKSLKNNPIEANTLIRILQDDLKNNFEISQKMIKDANNTENQWIVISWK